jgi:hypothetical protein
MNKHTWWTILIGIGVSCGLVRLLLSPYSSIEDADANGQRDWVWATTQQARSDTAPERDETVTPDLEQLSEFDEVQSDLVRSQQERLWLYVWQQ